MMIFTLIVLLMRKYPEGTTNINYWSSSMIRNLFIDTFENDVTNVDAIYDFLNTTVGPNLLIDDDAGTTPQLRTLSIIVGPIRLRQVRTVKGNCAKVWLHDKKS